MTREIDRDYIGAERWHNVFDVGPPYVERRNHYFGID